jgi:class 3 adenylate cyclase
MQAGKMDLSSRVVNTLFDRLTSKLTERRNTQRIYMILLAVGIVLSFTFFVLNVAQLLTRSRAIHQTEILLEDFCDIADGEVILKPDTSKIIRYYTSQMCFMDVETLEQASDEPGQIEISLRKACAVLEKLRPFVPRGAYLYSTVVQDQKKIDYACADDTEKDAAELEDVEVTCTRQNLSTTLVNTPAILMLVGTPFLHEGVEDAELVSRLVTLVHEVVDARGGIVVHVSEDGIMCVFNASVDEFTTTREGESDTVLAARDLLSQIEAGTDADALPVVITIASAPCLVGNLIGPITTAFQVVGPNVLRVNALQPVAHRHKVRILTDSHTVHALSSGWHMRPIERMTTDPNDPLNAYEILSQVPDLEEMDEAEKRDIMETEDKIRDRIASWVKAWTLYENAKDHLTDLLDEAGKEFAAYRSVHVPEGDEDPSLDILQRLIRAKLKELLGVDFHDTTKE